VYWRHYHFRNANCLFTKHSHNLTHIWGTYRSTSGPRGVGFRSLTWIEIICIDPVLVCVFQYSLGGHETLSYRPSMIQALQCMVATPSSASLGFKFHGQLSYVRFIARFVRTSEDPCRFLDTDVTEHENLSCYYSSELEEHKTYTQITQCTPNHALFPQIPS